MMLRVFLFFGLMGFALRGDKPLSRLLEQYRSTPPTATLCDRIGIAYTGSGELVNAERIFRQALKVNPDLVSARKNLGTVLWFLNHHAESENEFLRVARSAPRDPVAHLYLGLSAYDRKEYSVAGMHFDAAGSLASANPEVFPRLVETYFATGRVTDVTRLLEASAHSEPADPNIWIWLSKAYDRQDRPDDAYRALTKAIDSKEDTDEAYVALAEFASSHANRAFVRETVDRGLRHCPGSASLTLEKGILWALDGEFDKAAQLFSAAHQLAPSSSVPLLAMGVAQLQAGTAGESALTFQKAASLDPNDYRAEYLYATALSRLTDQRRGCKAQKRNSAVEGCCT